MTALPDVNTLVRVAIGEDSLLLPSRVEEVDSEEILIAAPAYVGDLAVLAAGDVISIYWTHSRGVCSLPAEFVRAERDRIRLWRLRPAGALEVVQRRRYTRVQAAGAVSLVDNGVDVVRVGWMIDLGEGGVRCRLAPGSFSADHPVECRLSLDGELVVVPGSVLRADPGVAGSEELIVTFDVDSSVCDKVRKFVSAQHRLARRVAASR